MSLKVLDGDGAAKTLKTSSDGSDLVPHHVVASSALPDGAATEAGQDAIVAAIEAIPGGGGGGGDASEATLQDILAKLSADPATQTTLAAVVAKLSSDPATQTTLAAVLAKLSADPATATGVAAIVTALAGAATATKQDAQTTALGTLASQTTAAAILAKLSADPATATGVAAIVTALGGTLTVNLPSGAATSAKQDAEAVLVGGVTETAPATDTASSGLNGRLQRLAQRLTALIALFPTSLGQKAKTGALAVTLASDEDLLGRLGEVQASPTSNTVLDRLKALATALAGTLTVGGTVTANAGTNLNTSALATSAKQDAEAVLVGAVTETVPGTDTASSGLNGRLQRIAQRLSSLIALIPAALGQTTKSGSMSVTVASDDDLQGKLGALTETAPGTDTASSGLNGRLQRLAQRLTSLIGLLPTALGSAAAASSLAVTSSTEDIARLGIVTETAPASDTASSGLNGRLQRIAQRITSMIALLPTALGAGGGLKVDGSGTALPVSLTTLPALVAGTALVGKVGIDQTTPGTTNRVVANPVRHIDVTLSLDTSAYASGDVLADTQQIDAAFSIADGRGVLQSLMVIDEDDQGVAMDVYLLSGSGSMGTENAAPSISDANARDILCRVRIATTDYTDLGGVKVADLSGLGRAVKAASGTDDLYVAVVNGTGTPTFTASGVRLRLGILE